MSNAIRVVLLASFASTALAQFDSGQIAGFVRDPSQSVIPGASITVTNEGNGQKHRTITNSSGYYVVPNLFVGSYSVEVETTGFKKSVQSGIQLSAAAKLSIDIELTVGSVTDSVEVNATATLVQSETATVGRTIDTKQIENLTTNGRNPSTWRCSSPASSAARSAPSIRTVSAMAVLASMARAPTSTS
jgi:hypothetical protein